MGNQADIKSHCLKVDWSGEMVDWSPAGPAITTRL